MFDENRGRNAITVKKKKKTKKQVCGITRNTIEFSRVTKDVTIRLLKKITIIYVDTRLAKFKSVYGIIFYYVDYVTAKTIKKDARNTFVRSTKRS